MSISNLFRESALNHSQTQPTLSALIIVKPAAWLYVLCAGCFLAALLVWAWCGKVELSVQALGIIVTETDFKEAETMLKTNISEHQEKLTILHELFIKQKQLYQNHYITINELEKTRQDYLTAKEELAAISKQNVVALIKPLFKTNDSTNHPAMDALLFVSHNSGKKLKAGMKVHVLPNTLSAYEFGYLRGEVLEISDYPVTKDTVNSFLVNMSLVDEFFQGSAPFMVKVRLVPDAKTVSGLAWTTPKGADFEVEAGTTVTARIVHRVTAPIALIHKQV